MVRYRLRSNSPYSEEQEVNGKKAKKMRAENARREKLILAGLTEWWDGENHQCENDPIDCSPISPFHSCDNATGTCEATCPDDGEICCSFYFILLLCVNRIIYHICSSFSGNACTVDGWNSTLNDCYTPLVCPPRALCDPTMGCFDLVAMVCSQFVFLPFPSLF